MGRDAIGGEGVITTAVDLATAALIIGGWFFLSLPIAILLGRALRVNDLLGAGQPREADHDRGQVIELSRARR